jgi:hypothetical protein
MPDVENAGRRTEVAGQKAGFAMLVHGESLPGTGPSASRVCEILR